MTDARHVPWPKRPDGTNMTIGEMSPEDERAQLKAAALRWADKYGRSPELAVQLVLAKHGML
jgi:hypothetical protein